MESTWEKIYEGGKLLKTEPHDEIENIIKIFRSNKANRILDLGNGGGRHLIYLARKGFDVYGLDSSPTGLAFTLSCLADENLVAHLTLSDMEKLPYDDHYFDAIISVQVIHHNMVSGIRNTINEIQRVLVDNGLIWITMPVSKNEPSKRQKEVEPGTFVPLDGIEKGLPHHYFPKDEIPGLFSECSILDLHVDNTNHYSLITQKVSSLT